MGVWKNLLKEEFILDNFESNSEKLQKMISANVKADVKQQELKDLVAVSCNFLWEVPSKLATQCKTGMYVLF